jgi:hypothetical protein
MSTAPSVARLTGTIESATMRATLPRSFAKR